MVHWALIAAADVGCTTRGTGTLEVPADANVWDIQVSLRGDPPESITAAAGVLHDYRLRATP
jgi:hypothetical protein